MKAKSDAVCLSCGTRVIMRAGTCYKCFSARVSQRTCDLCHLDIRVGQDITWDRRGNKWEAHTSCWLNSSPEARERIIRKQQQSTLQKLASEKYKEWEQKQERKIEIPTFSESEPESEPEVDVDFPEVTPSEDKEVIPPGINIEMEN